MGKTGNQLTKKFTLEMTNKMGEGMDGEGQGGVANFWQEVKELEKKPQNESRKGQKLTEFTSFD